MEPTQGTFGFERPIEIPAGDPTLTRHDPVALPPLVKGADRRTRDVDRRGFERQPGAFAVLADLIVTVTLLSERLDAIERVARHD